MANTGFIKTSVVVSFKPESDETSGVVKLEIDNREPGSKNEDTNFQGGDTVYLLLFQSDNVKTISWATTAGTFTVTSTKGILKKEETVDFADSKTGSVSYPVKSVESATWLGQSFIFDKDGKPTPGSPGSLPASPSDFKNGTDIVFEKRCVGALKICYNTEFTECTLSNTPLRLGDSDTYSIIIFGLAKIEN